MKTETPRTDERKASFALDTIRQLERELTAVTEQLDRLDSMYHKIIKELLECDPIPACKRKDDQLEPPWEVIARIREQRDRLAEALERVMKHFRQIAGDCQEEEQSKQELIDAENAEKALQSLTTNTPDQERKSPASDCSI